MRKKYANKCSAYSVFLCLCYLKHWLLISFPGKFYYLDEISSLKLKLDSPAKVIIIDLLLIKGFGEMFYNLYIQELLLHFLSIDIGFLQCCGRKYGQSISMNKYLINRF